MEISDMMDRIHSELTRRGGLKAVYFVGCGGSQAAVYSANYLLSTESKHIPTALFNSAEFTHAMPGMVDERCLVVCISLKATAQTVDAVKAANDRGAVTIAMTGSPDTLMAKTGQYPLVYSNGEHQIYSKGNQAQSLKLVFELLRQFEGYDRYDAAMASFDAIDDIVADAKRAMLPKAQAFAREYRDDGVFFVMGSGPLYGTAVSMANCHLMEMQRKHAVRLHSDEFFQGPFEMVDPKLPVILLKSNGRTRPMDERAEAFLSRYAERFLVIDAKETGLSRLDSSVAEFFESVVMIPVERFFVECLSGETGHSMDLRRYMWKVAY